MGRGERTEPMADVVTTRGDGPGRSRDAALGEHDARPRGERARSCDLGICLLLLKASGRRSTDREPLAALSVASCANGWLTSLAGGGVISGGRCGVAASIAPLRQRVEQKKAVCERENALV